MDPYLQYAVLLAFEIIYTSNSVDGVVSQNVAACASQLVDMLRQPKKWADPTAYFQCPLIHFVSRTTVSTVATILRIISNCITYPEEWSAFAREKALSMAVRLVRQSKRCVGWHPL